MISARTEPIADDAQLPYLPYWLAIGTMTLIAASLMLPIAAGTRWPSAAIILTASTSAVCLAVLGLSRDRDQGFMRIGFHAGVVAFFLLMPMLFPEEIATRISSETREQIDLILLVGVLGFEGGYWFTRVARLNRHRQELAIDGTESAPGFLVWLIVIGVLAWAAYQVAFAASIGARLIDVLLAMRNPIEGAPDDVDFAWRYGQRVAMAMLFASAAAGCVIAVDRRAATSVRILAWAVIACVTVSGFLTGSRGYFLFAVVPAAVGCWLTAMRLPGVPRLRVLLVSGAAVSIVAAWFVMSAVRDVARLEDRLDHPIMPLAVVESAFDIYSQMAIVVESFPRIVEYQYGASAIPVFFGWVPRTLWPQKPYPFSLVMTQLHGEDLDYRTASLTAGLPAEGYGNFGMAGVLLWVAVMGVFCRLGDDYLQKIGVRHASALQLACIWCIWVALIVRGGVAEMFYLGLEVTLAPLAMAIVASKRSTPLPDSGDVTILSRRLA